jgi:hypothetical protein
MIPAMQTAMERYATRNNTLAMNGTLAMGRTLRASQFALTGDTVALDARGSNDPCRRASVLLAVLVNGLGPPLAIHLDDELHTHEFVELLKTRALRHFGGKPLGISEYLMHMCIPAADHLRRPIGQNIEGGTPRPFRQQASRVLFELGAAEV